MSKIGGEGGLVATRCTLTTADLVCEQNEQTDGWMTLAGRLTQRAGGLGLPLWERFAEVDFEGPLMRSSAGFVQQKGQAILLREDGQQRSSGLVYADAHMQAQVFHTSAVRHRRRTSLEARAPCGGNNNNNNEERHASTGYS
jgi:hypothetical protein